MKSVKFHFNFINWQKLLNQPTVPSQFVINNMSLCSAVNDSNLKDVINIVKYLQVDYEAIRIYWVIRYVNKITAFIKKMRSPIIVTYDMQRKPENYVLPVTRFRSFAQTYKDVKCQKSYKYLFQIHHQFFIISFSHHGSKQFSWIIVCSWILALEIKD